MHRLLGVGREFSRDAQGPLTKIESTFLEFVETVILVDDIANYAASITELLNLIVELMDHFLPFFVDVNCCVHSSIAVPPTLRLTILFVFRFCQIQF